MVDAHVDMMRSLREDSRSRPWYGRLFRDYNDKPFKIGMQYYEIEELRVKGVTVQDFLLTGMSWDHFHGLGYRIADLKQLGGTLDDARAMGIRIDHIVGEFEHVTSDFVTTLLHDKSDLLQWTPAELFKMGFTMDALLRLGCNHDMIPLSEMQYFFSPSTRQAMLWTASVPTAAATRPAIGADARPPREFSTIQIDVSKLT